MLRKLISIAVVGLFLLMPLSSTAKVEKLDDYANNLITINGSVTEDTFIEFVKSIGKIDYTTKEVTILLHTSGGDAYSTIAITNMIRDMKAAGYKFTMIVYGKAFSAGSYIFLQGDNRVIYEGAGLMFHTIMQQKSKSTREYMRKNDRNLAVHISHMEQMDEFMRDRFKEVANCSDEVADYFLNGSKDEETKAQFMSGLTAYNLGIATHYITN